MTYEFKGQQPIVVMKQGNACGAKGHSRLINRWNAVCGESRLHGVRRDESSLNG